MAPKRTLPAIDARTGRVIDINPEHLSLIVLHALVDFHERRFTVLPVPSSGPRKGTLQWGPDAWRIEAIDAEGIFHLSRGPVTTEAKVIGVTSYQGETIPDITEYQGLRIMSQQGYVWRK